MSKRKTGKERKIPKNKGYALRTREKALLNERVRFRLGAGTPNVHGSPAFNYLANRNKLTQGKKKI